MILRILLSIFIFFTIFSCAQKPNFMKYQVVFYTTLGSETNQVGSNLDKITNFFTNEKSFLVSDYLHVPTSIQIFRNKIYIADIYNQRISIFNIGGEPTNIIIISSQSNQIFGIPFQIVLNKYGEIYVVASMSNYADIYLDMMTNENSKVSINPKQYFIYKFSIDGKLIYAIGENGINSGPMYYPERINIDLFDNVYAYFKEIDDQEREYWIVKRFSPSGELSFEFNTKYISITNRIDDSVFAGRISDIYNLKNDEKLLIYSENYIVSKKGVDVEPPDVYFNSVDVYSILQNTINKNIFRSEKLMDQFIAVTKDDVLVFYSYDERYHGIRFRFIDTSTYPYKEEIYYAPVLSSYFPNFGFYVDNLGNIYSIIVKENTYFVVLQWKKRKSRVNI